MTTLTVRIKDAPQPTVLARAAVMEKKLAALKPLVLLLDQGQLAAWQAKEGIDDLERELELLVKAATPPEPEPEEPSKQIDWIDEDEKGTL